MKHNIYEFSLFLKILYFIPKGSLNIPEYRCLLIGRVQFLYAIETVGENIVYHWSLLLSYLWTYTLPTSERPFCLFTSPPLRTLCVLHNVMSKTGFLNQQTLTGCIQTSSVKLKPFTILVIICILFLPDLTSNYKIQSESIKMGDYSKYSWENEAVIIQISKINR